jgi:anti-anti-sigma regulatory factor
MGIRNLSEDIIFVEIPSDSPRIAEELKAVNETVSNERACHVIIDFSRVEIINSSNISNLLILRNFLQDSGHQLILCDVTTVTKCIFVVAGLSEVFVFVNDKFTALAAIKSAKLPTSAISQ